MTTSKPQFYAACLASYNAGVLHGAWIDLDSDPDIMRDEIAAMLAASDCPGAEEWAIHDYDGMPNLGEYVSVQDLAALGELYEEHGPVAFALYEYDAEYAREWLENEPLIHSGHGSPADWAYELASELGMLPSKPMTLCDVDLLGYIDWDAVARDLCVNTYTEATWAGETYYVSNH